MFLGFNYFIWLAYACGPRCLARNGLCDQVPGHSDMPNVQNFHRSGILKGFTAVSSKNKPSEGFQAILTSSFVSESAPACKP